MSICVQVGRRKLPAFKVLGAGKREVKEGREAGLGRDEVAVEVAVPVGVGTFMLAVPTDERGCEVVKFGPEGTRTLLGPPEAGGIDVDFRAVTDLNCVPSEAGTRRGPDPCGRDGRGGAIDLGLAACLPAGGNGSTAVLSGVSGIWTGFLVLNDPVITALSSFEPAARSRLLLYSGLVESFLSCPLGLVLLMILGAGTIAGISGVVPSLFFGVTKWVDFFWPGSTVRGTTNPEEASEHLEAPIGAFGIGETDIDIDLAVRTVSCLVSEALVIGPPTLLRR